MLRMCNVRDAIFLYFIRTRALCAAIRGNRNGSRSCLQHAHYGLSIVAAGDTVLAVV